MKTFSQEEFYIIMKTYNTMDRKTITINLITIYKRCGIKNKNVMEKLGYNPHKVNSWTAMSSPNIPTFEDALLLATIYGFNIDELIKQ